LELDKKVMDRQVFREGEEGEAGEKV